MGSDLHDYHRYYPVVGCTCQAIMYTLPMYTYKGDVIELRKLILKK
jgi:hypothetical protein